MQHDLCLTLDDVSFLSKNVAVHKRGVSASFKKQAKEWQYLDDQLYNYFNKTLWRKIDEFGLEKMKHAVSELNQLNTDKSTKCIEKLAPEAELPVQFRDYVPPGVKFEGIKPYQNASAEW